MQHSQDHLKDYFGHKKIFKKIKGEIKIIGM